MVINNNPPPPRLKVIYNNIPPHKKLISLFYWDKRGKNWQFPFLQKIVQIIMTWCDKFLVCFWTQMLAGTMALTRM